MTICSRNECNGMEPHVPGVMRWDLDSWHPDVCGQCGGSGFLFGIGNREVPCDEKCSECGGSVHSAKRTVYSGGAIDELKFLSGLEFLPVEGPENLGVTQKIGECRVTVDVPKDSALTYINPNTFEPTHLYGKVKIVFALLRLPVRTNGGGAYKIVTLIPPQEEMVLPRLVDDGVPIE